MLGILASLSWLFPLTGQVSPSCLHYYEKPGTTKTLSLMMGEGEMGEALTSDKEKHERRWREPKLEAATSAGQLVAC